MKKKYTLIVMLFIVSIASSQQLYLTTGQRSSSFKYTDSKGNKLDNIYSKTFDYLALGFRHENIMKNINLSFGLNYGGYGAIGSDDLLDKYMEWNLKYLETDIGIDIKLFSIRKINIYVKGDVAFGFMTKGIQILDKQVINLKGNMDFENPSVNLKGGLCLMYPINYEVSFIAHFLMGHSNDISRGNEKLNISSNNIDLGLLINL